jgi:hypothetical protein
VIFEGVEPPPRIVPLSVGYRAFSSGPEAAALAQTLCAVLRSAGGERTSERGWAATTATIGTTG